MSLALYIFSSVGVVAVVSIMTVVAQNASYREGFRGGYKKASYEAAKIQVEINKAGYDR